MTKSKNIIVTIGAPCLAIDILRLGRYLFSVVHGNRYSSKGVKENVYILSTTITGNLFGPR